MNTKRLTPAQRRRLAQTPGWSPQGVGLAPELYAAALRYLFDRPVPRLERQEAIDRTVEAYIRSIDKNDRELKDYADAARRGCVQ